MRRSDRDRAAGRSGAADIASILIAAELRNRERKRIARIERVVLQKLPGAAMKCVGAGFRDHKHLNRIAPTLRAEGIGLHTEFRDSIHVRDRHAALVHGRIRIQAVKLELGLVVACAHSLDGGPALRTAGSEVAHARSETHERDRITLAQGQFPNLPHLNHGLDIA